MIPGQSGGSFVSTIRFAELLNKRGHKAIILAAKDTRQAPVTKFLNIPIYQFPSLPTPGSERLYFASFPKARELESIFLRENINVVHTMFPSYSCYLAAKVAKRMGIPVISHFHTQPENILVFLPKILRGSFFENLAMRYLTYFARRARVVISPSELGKRILTNFDQSLVVEVISNGIDLSRFKKTPYDEFVTNFNLSKNRKFILFVGRLMIEKNVEVLIRAIPKIVDAVPTTHLLVVGTGPLKKDLEKLCVDLGISGHVSFLGKISDKDLLMAYNLCDLYAYPSMVELEGMVVLEAMACGKPILIADSTTSASRFFVKGNGFLFHPNDTADLANKAISILNDDNLKDKMSIESTREVQLFDINKSIDKLEKVYKSVIS
ncbi:glycosyltransferase [Patescibacteria group bacterium]|nr:glycosyltransferase [Patescibacteria group bacterium]MDE1946490.1 glycosyltransferase [Patescibacteria group bacterium]